MRADHREDAGRKFGLLAVSLVARRRGASCTATRVRRITSAFANDRELDEFHASGPVGMQRSVRS